MTIAVLLQVFQNLSLKNQELHPKIPTGPNGNGGGKQPVGALQGFAANAVGTGTGLMSNSISGGDVALDTAIVGAAGGAVSVLTGGKFAAGFITASFANLFQ